jgi:hypothetical protein
MSILLDEDMDLEWYGDPGRNYYTQQAALRNNSVRGRSGTGRYLVAGHGWGHLVQALRNGGNTNTWGCDLSAYAVTKSKQVYPAIADRFHSADCRSTTSMNTLRNAIFTSGSQNQRFWDVIITEDLLSAQGPKKRPEDYTEADWDLGKAEAVACQTALRSVLMQNGILVHIISMRQEDTIGYEMEGFWKTGEAWRAILGPGAYIVRLRDLQEF